MIRALLNALLVEEAELYPGFLSQWVNVATVEEQGKSDVPIVVVRDIYDFDRDAPDFNWVWCGRGSRLRKQSSAENNSRLRSSRALMVSIFFEFRIDMLFRYMLLVIQ